MKKPRSFLRTIKSSKKDFMLLYKTGRHHVFSRFRKYRKLRSSKKMKIEEFINYEEALKDKEFCETFLTFREAWGYWKVLNPSGYYALAKDKYISHLLLEKEGVPTPVLYAYYHPEKGESSFEALRKELELKNVQSCVVKPAVDGAHGAGVFVCKELDYMQDDIIITKSNGEQLSLRDFFKKNKSTSWLFEEIVVQSDQRGKINRSSVNTVRFMTALYPDGSAKVFATFMKIGRAGSDVDNAGGGGNVDCAINIETGECYNALQFNSYTDVKKVDNHPDSGEKINGVHIENWEEIKKCLCDYQAHIPQLKVIGWDVALTDKGPVIIEINNYWDTTGQLFLGRGWREEVRDCYFAWKEYYKSIK